MKDLSAVPVHAKLTGQPRTKITEVNINPVQAAIDEDGYVC